MVEFGQVYIDSSVAGRLTLAQPEALHEVIWSAAVSSELIVTELHRAVRRSHALARSPECELVRLCEKADRSLAELTLVPIDRTILRRAGGHLPVPLKTLDAIHLATALLWSDYEGDITFLTHDRRLALAARACGLAVYPRPV